MMSRMRSEREDLPSIITDSLDEIAVAADWAAAFRVPEDHIRDGQLIDSPALERQRGLLRGDLMRVVGEVARRLSDEAYQDAQRLGASRSELAGAGSPRAPWLVG